MKKSKDKSDKSMLCEQESGENGSPKLKKKKKAKHKSKDKDCSSSNEHPEELNKQSENTLVGHASDHTVENSIDKSKKKKGLKDDSLPEESFEISSNTASGEPKESEVMESSPVSKKKKKKKKSKDESDGDNLATSENVLKESELVEKKKKKKHDPTSSDNENIEVEQDNIKKSKRKKKKWAKGHGDKVNNNADQKECQSDEVTRENSCEVDSDAGRVVKNKKKKNKKRHAEEAEETIETSCEDAFPSADVEPPKKKKKKKDKDKSYGHDQPSSHNGAIANSELQNGAGKTEHNDTKDKNGHSCEKQAAPFAGQWATADMGSSDRQQKFLRLLGGFKKSNDGPAKPGLFGAKNSGGNFALSGRQQTELNQKLEQQYENALSLRLNKHKGGGLGFQADPSEGKKFHIDVNKSKSLKFDE